MRVRTGITWAALLGAICAVPASARMLQEAEPVPPDTVLATVNGVEITAADLEIEFLSRGVPAEARDEFRDRFLNDLVDRALVAAYLKKRRAPVSEQLLDRQMELVKLIIERSGEGEELESVLARLGFSEQSLREYISLPLAWNGYVRRTVTDDQLRNYFDVHRSRFDGTEIRVSHIVMTVDDDAPEQAWQDAEQTLAAVRERIAAGEISFADAAKEASTSPSAEQGGDVGFVSYRGELPRAVLDAAFSLEEGELSEVLQTPFGVHLVTVTARKPGDLSLEDVREEVWQEVIEQEWDELVQAERESARIRWKTRRPERD
ncbi:MAG: hypothetical protein DWQ34_22550 [Planctomycetota bacterium]|nr:MAG: hypothetical protein DWQ29_10390 [Planctomycetota bacterium]REJ88371.1 MAG: hypothetical protein DWQ34_22550 [Planctomycetota bacterium]REK30667.1 MAG: hypothetical protein DWQ41_01595 [Planctomycetota bacterium]REK33041.1 MAG: hypothetical protein DWQ45_15695 [Planctomycetota bacterium]